jgi:hypothetical protein
MTDEEVTCSGCGEYAGSHISDRIEALTAERDWYMEEWVSAVDKLNKAMDVLRDAESQLVYLDERRPTGTTPTILARIKAFFTKQGESHE